MNITNYQYMKKIYFNVENFTCLDKCPFIDANIGSAKCSWCENYIYNDIDSIDVDKNNFIYCKEFNKKQRLEKLNSLTE